MFRTFRLFKSWFAVITVALLAGLIMVAQQPRQVNDALLKTGSKTGDEWVSYGVNSAEQRYSPLKEIDASNVGRLGLAWSYDIPYAPVATGNPETHQEGTPLVFNGVLYSITPWSIVYAVDLKTHKEVWKADPEVNQQIWRSRICCGVVNRGIAMYEGKIIAPVVDGRLRALDAATGRILWETRVSPENQAYTITMAPRVIKGGKIIIGVSGGEFAVRGFFSAYDVNTGKMAWRFYTVPGDPSKPFEHPELAAAAKTWSNDWWKLGGGAGVWNGMAYDADNDIVYVGTGQPGPWTDYHRGPGDNLYSCSILAVRGATGKMVWYYQEVPGDDWDYDSIADLMLADLTINGKQRKVIMHAPKDAFFYVIDRLTGEVISADPITKVSWTTGMDAKGHPIVNPGARYKTTPVNVNPGPSGGHVWPPWSYNPGTGLVYIPGTAGQGSNYTAAQTFTPVPTDIGPSGRGVVQMGTSLGGRGGNQAKGAPPAGTPAESPEQAAVRAQQEAAAARGCQARASGHLRTRWTHGQRSLCMGSDREERTLACACGRRWTVFRRQLNDCREHRVLQREQPAIGIPRRYGREAPRTRSSYLAARTADFVHDRRQAVHQRCGWTSLRRRPIRRRARGCERWRRSRRRSATRALIGAGH